MTTGHSDHYRALGIPVDSPPEAVKAAWRRAARKYHPDSGGLGADTSAFNRAIEAWKVLGDSESRRAYDTAQTPPSPAATGAREAYAPQSSQSRYSRTREPREQSSRNTSVTFRTTVMVPLSEAYAGRPVVAVKSEAMEACRTCEGTGEVVAILPCTFCHGHGRTAFESMVLSCPRCRSSGKIISACQCRVCRGEGMMLAREAAAVRLPDGIWDGSVVMASMPSGKRVQVKIGIARVKPWRFEDGYLCITRRFSAKRLERGTTCMIGLPDGRKIRLKVPVGTKPGTQLKMPRTGMRNQSGDRAAAMVLIEMS